MSIDTEAVSVLAIKEAITSLGYLTENIRTEDNTPIWDEFVYLYKTADRNKRNSDFVGRIPIQIKGVDRSKIRNNYFPERITYKLEWSNIDAYITDGGVILFVVYVKDYNTKCIYYNALLPFDLAVIKTNGNTTKASIALKKFPSSDHEGLSTFHSFIRDRQKQRGTVDNKRLSFDQWNGVLGSIEHLTFTIDVAPGPHISRGEILSLAHDFYLYAKPKDLDLHIPVERIEQPKMVRVENDFRIGAGDQEFFDGTYTIWSQGDAQIHFGNAMCVKLYRKDTGRGLKVNISIKGTLFEQIRDLEFVKVLFETGFLLINSMSHKITQLSNNQKQEIEKYIDKLAFLKNIQRKLNLMGITSDLIIDTIKKNEIWKLALIEKIGSGENCSNVLLNDPIQILYIANMKILLSVTTSNNEKKIDDFFRSTHTVIGRDNEDKEHRVSQYLLLKALDLDVDNFRADVVFEDITKYEIYDGYLELVNFFLLELINAYDNNNNKNRDEIYHLSINLCKWLLSLDDCTIYRMNYYQLKLRKEALTNEETEFCVKISSDEEASIRAGALILLGEHSRANEVIEQLNETAKTEFKSYPIYNLLNRECDH
ncbi:MAG: hypothetical protein GX556_20660 [Fibrobacter sp.]|nr:hypothetical protein [Fibrobacter sp.]